MFYQLKHVTAYRYSEPVRESHMEARMQPRSEGFQRCWSFRLTTSPRAEVSSYTDSLGNIVHHFDVPTAHSRLILTSETVIEVSEQPGVPDGIDPSWDDLVALPDDDEMAFEMLQPSRFAHGSDLLEQFARLHGIDRESDPLTTMRKLNATIYNAFAYAPQTTQVDSPIDHALEERRGVCQDFAHIMIALGRRLGIPCRYVSGYLFHRVEDHDRSEADASHAWVEALLPGLGWVGFDPTNNLLAGDRHIRTAIGRDYADVPPTRGVFKGEARTDSELTVSVKVAPTNTPPPLEPAQVLTSSVVTAGLSDLIALQQSQQQQQ